MAKLIIQVKDTEGKWSDYKDDCKTQKEAKEFIREQAGGCGVENWRIIMLVAHCKTEVIFINDLVGNDEKITVDMLRDISPASEEKVAKEIVELENKIKKKNAANKTNDKSKENIITKSKIKSDPRQQYSDHELKLLYFERSCELEHWAKTYEFDDVDRDKYPTWFTYQYRFGSKSNVVDMVCHELHKDPISLKYQEIIDKYYIDGKERHTGVYVIKKLAGGNRK